MALPNQFDAEFKRNAVDVWANSGKSLKAVSRELGIIDVMLRSWGDRILGRKGENKRALFVFPLVDKNWFQKANGFDAPPC